MAGRVILARFASGEPMGQQHYETHLMRTLPTVARPGWSFPSLTVSSLRSQLGADVRLPLRLVERAPLAVLETLGRVLYRGSDLVHRLDLRLPPRPGGDLVTIHDLAPLRYDDEGSLSAAVLDSARRAAGVVCPSEFSAAEVRSLIGPRQVWVAPYAAHESFTMGQALTGPELAALGVDKPFVLCSGGATRRKNLAVLAAAWSTVRAAHPTATLVLSGPPDPRRSLAFADVAGTRLVGRLPLATLVGLMRASSVVVVPSTYEGFGLPALEGMACGVPVVAAARASLPEVCGDAAILVEPTADGLASGLISALSGGPEVEALRRAGPRRAATFSWARTAEAHLAAYAEALLLATGSRQR